MASWSRVTEGAALNARRRMAPVNAAYTTSFTEVVAPAAFLMALTRLSGCAGTVTKRRWPENVRPERRSDHGA